MQMHTNSYFKYKKLLWKYTSIKLHVEYLCMALICHDLCEIHRRPGVIGLYPTSSKSKCICDEEVYFA